MFAFLQGIGAPELLIILAIFLLLFGAKKLPELARGLGKSIKEFKKATSGLEEELKSVIEEEAPAPKETEKETEEAKKSE